MFPSELTRAPYPAGFLHAGEIAVRFERGPIESVELGEVLYTGRLLTLLAWAVEFIAKRLQGRAVQPRP